MVNSPDPDPLPVSAEEIASGSDSWTGFAGQYGPLLLNFYQIKSKIEKGWRGRPAAYF
jgi:hypothetical protein